MKKKFTFDFFASNEESKEDECLAPHHDSPVSYGTRVNKSLLPQQSFLGLLSNPTRSKFGKASNTRLA